MRGYSDSSPVPQITRTELEKAGRDLIVQQIRYAIALPGLYGPLEDVVSTLFETQCDAVIDEIVRHEPGDYNGGEYDWACNCGAVGHWNLLGAKDTWENHIRSLFKEEKS